MTDAEIRRGLGDLRAEIATALHEGECCPNRPTLRHSDLVLIDAALQRLADLPADIDDLFPPVKHETCLLSLQPAQRNDPPPRLTDEQDTKALWLTRRLMPTVSKP